MKTYSEEQKSLMGGKQEVNLAAEHRPFPSFPVSYDESKPHTKLLPSPTPAQHESEQVIARRLQHQQLHLSVSKKATHVHLKANPRSLSDPETAGAFTHHHLEAHK